MLHPLKAGSTHDYIAQTQCRFTEGKGGGGFNEGGVVLQSGDGKREMVWERKTKKSGRSCHIIFAVNNTLCVWQKVRCLGTLMRASYNI